MPACGNRQLADMPQKSRNRVVRSALKRTRGNVSAAARMLGVTPRTVYRWLKEAA